MTPRHRRLAVYVALVALAVWGLLRQQYTVDELHELVAREAAEDDVEEAVRCIGSWEVRGEIRRSDEEHGRAAGEALIDVVQPEDPAVVEEYRARLAERLQDASATIDDPDCDLEAAEALVERSAAGSTAATTPAATVP